MYAMLMEYLTIQSSYRYVYQQISNKQLLQISRRHGQNYTKWYLLFDVFLSIHRLATETPEVINTSVRVISRLYEYALEFIRFPSRSTNNAECLVHNAYLLQYQGNYNARMNHLYQWISFYLNTFT